MGFADSGRPRVRVIVFRWRRRLWARWDMASSRAFSSSRSSATASGKDVSIIIVLL